MEESLSIAIGYGQRIGELLNEAVHHYERRRASLINELERHEDETETTRKAKLDGWLADDKKLVSDLKNLQTHLKALRMSLFQAIKTRREEPKF